ncbi:MAG: zinc dependent phospholipase C family protein [Bacillota bacterium]|nr:zinc dependent phospholipase C family protein [Bacillota bacterium]
MPNIITHILFARDMKDKLDQKYRVRIEENEQLFEVGSNGPDFTFFYGLTPTRIQDKVPLSKLGSQMHRHKVNDFYQMALTVIRKENNPSVKEDMIVYTWGHLCHWALDSCVHPYVLFRTGNCKGQSSWWHHRFESCLDALVLKQKTGLTTKDFKAKDICDVSLEKARAICRIYVPIAHHVFEMPEIKGHHIFESLQDWYFIQKCLYDPFGVKYDFVLPIEKTLNKVNLLSGLLVPNKPVDAYDITNLKHSSWTHPCDDTLVSCESFFDLYDKALDKAQKAIELFTEAIDVPESESQLLAFINDRSYNLNRNDQAPMLHFDRIQDHL